MIGLKIRVPQSQMYTDCWSTLGATPVALALTELTTGLSNGTAQAQDNATYHEGARCQGRHDQLPERDEEGS